MSEIKPEMVKVRLDSATARNVRRDVGKAIERACSLVGWSKKELAGRLAGEDGNIDAWVVKLHRWMSGEERPHLDALLSVEEFCQPLLLVLTKEFVQGAEVTTEIRFRRIA